MDNTTILYNFPPGNIIPHEWYKHITTKSGKPDLPAITILSEIVYWFRPKTHKSNNQSISQPINKFVGNAWQTSYSYLKNKFCYNHQRIRRALIRLEELKLINRKFQTIHLRGQKYNNVLFIAINFKSLEKISLDIKILSTANSFTNSHMNKFVAPSLQNESSHIDNKNKKRNISKNRSSKSKFYENFEEKKLEEVFEEAPIVLGSLSIQEENRGQGNILPIAPVNSISSVEVLGQNTIHKIPTAEANNTASNYSKAKNLEKHQDITSTSITEFIVNEDNINSNNEKVEKTKILASLNLIAENSDNLHSATVNKIKANLGYSENNFRIKKPLADFYPITKEEIWSLRSDSGREFDLCYINKLMQHLAKKYPNNSFYGRKQVLQYLAKALKHELRQAPMVNNQGFRFKSEINNDEAKIEKYLAETEYSKDTSFESQFRRKIAAVFTPSFAYELLQNITINKVETQAMTIYMAKMIEFDQGKIELLLNQVKAVYGEGIERIDINCNNNEYVMSAAQGIVQVPTLNIKRSEIGNSNNIAYNSSYEETIKASKTTNPLWQKIRAKLINHYGEAIDKSWFSKLQAGEIKQEEGRNKDLTLIAPTNFIKSWIESNYLLMICRFAKDELYENYRNITIIGPQEC